MANEQNLRPFTSDQSREEAAKNGRKGGKKSGESRRRKKSMRENLQMLMELQIVNPDMIKTMKEIGVPDDEMTYQSAVNIARLNAALSMNIKAIDSVDELLGEGIKSKQLKETKRSNRAKEKLMAENNAALNKAAESIEESEIRNENIRNIANIIKASGQTGLKEGD